MLYRYERRVQVKINQSRNKRRQLCSTSAAYSTPSFDCSGVGILMNNQQHELNTVRWISSKYGYFWPKFAVARWSLERRTSHVPTEVLNRRNLSLSPVAQREIRKTRRCTWLEHSPNNPAELAHVRLQQHRTVLVGNYDILSETRNNDTSDAVVVWVLINLASTSNPSPIYRPVPL